MKRAKDKGKELHYIGVLCNVDRSILNFSFGLNYKTEVRIFADIVGLLTRLSELPSYEVEIKLENKYHYKSLPDREVFVIANTFHDWRSELDVTGKINVDRLIESYVRPQAHEKYLQNKIKMLRLFGPGDISLPINCFYTIKNGQPSMENYSEDEHIFDHRVFTISRSNLAQINKFFSRYHLPFKVEYLQSAFDHFNLSYEVSENHLAFMSLMIALEILFNDGGQEIAYKISRGVAILLGANKKDSIEIFDNVKKLYSKRSQLVHAGKKTSIKDVDIDLLREYLGKMIRLLLELSIGKEALLMQLTSTGFEDSINWSV